MPPPPVTGMKLVAVWFWVSVGVATDCDAVTAKLTVWVSVDDELAAKLASPRKVATTECDPTPSAAVQFAVPIDTSCEGQPKIVDPSLVNLTVLSLTVLVLVTVAVKISVCGEVAGLRDEATVVVVGFAA